MAAVHGDDWIIEVDVANERIKISLGTNGGGMVSGEIVLDGTCVDDYDELAILFAQAAEKANE